MKKALIILAVLAVLLVGVFCVYYFVWTAANMNAWGDEAYEEGKLEKAITWYERAVDAEPTNLEYVFDLVDANIRDGNFTQAERTLIRAIEKKPDAALYAKLSSVYAAQDKLLDAQRLLDGIADPTIRAELDARRPACPMVTPTGGEYHELVNISIKSDALVYYCLGDGFPSVLTEPYSEEFTLEAGTNRLRAIAVSEDGLVSSVYDATYLLVGVVQEISFASPELESVIRSMLYLPAEEPVLSSHLWEITEFEVPVEVTDYTDLAHFENLEKLTIHGSVVEDYSFMSALFALKELDVSGSYISDDALKYIGLLPALEHLNLSNCGRSDISALAAAVNLVSLDLSSNSIRDITALEGLQKLETLYLQGNAITLLESLGKMSALTELNISNNNLASLDPLESSKGLVKLIADNNQLMDVSVLLSMPKLTHFTAANNRIGDVSYLSSCTQMTHLDLGNNRLTAIDAIANMTRLSYLDISNNAITALPELPTMAQLQYFYASHNELTNIEMLANQPLLAYVDVDYNPELKDIICLASCPMLIKVDAFGTKVSEIQALLDMSVIVNYDPSAVVDAEDD